jgi:hypothetical protein
MSQNFVANFHDLNPKEKKKVGKLQGYLFLQTRTSVPGLWRKGIEPSVLLVHCIKPQSAVKPSPDTFDQQTEDVYYIDVSDPHAPKRYPEPHE